MSDQDKQAECQRLCGEMGKRGIHSIAPVRCPIVNDQWMNPKRK